MKVHLVPKTNNKKTGKVAATYIALCEWCADHEGHQTPETVDIFPAWLSGTPVASCRECGMRWGYWECGCELAHDCDGEA